MNRTESYESIGGAEGEEVGGMGWGEEGGGDYLIMAEEGKMEEENRRGAERREVRTKGGGETKSVKRLQKLWKCAERRVTKLRGC